LIHSTSEDDDFNGDCSKSVNFMVCCGYFNHALSFSAWAWSVFPNFLSSSVSLSKVYNFHCKNLLPLGLNLFLYIFFSTINVKLSWFLFQVLHYWHIAVVYTYMCVGWGWGRLWTQGFMLAKLLLYNLSHTSGPFFVRLFWGYGLLCILLLIIFTFLNPSACSNRFLVQLFLFHLCRIMSSPNRFYSFLNLAPLLSFFFLTALTKTSNTQFWIKGVKVNILVFFQILQSKLSESPLSI
jgi:hypothetical protein